MTNQSTDVYTYHKISMCYLDYIFIHTRKKPITITTVNIYLSPIAENMLPVLIALL